MLMDVDGNVAGAAAGTVQGYCTTVHVSVGDVMEERRPLHRDPHAGSRCARSSDGGERDRVCWQTRCSQASQPCPPSRAKISPRDNRDCCSLFTKPHLFLATLPCPR